MSKISPRSNNYRGVQTGTDDGRRRQNVFNPNLFTDDYADGLKDMKMNSKTKNVAILEEQVKRDMTPLSKTQSSAMNDVVAKKVTSQKDRFDRFLDAKALAEVVATVPLPYTVAVCAEGGHGKTFFLRLLKKCLDPAVVEDPDTREMFQHFEKKSYQSKERHDYNQSQSEDLFEAEANETAEAYRRRDAHHDMQPRHREHAGWYRFKMLFLPCWVCVTSFVHCLLCVPLSFCHLGGRRQQERELAHGAGGVLYWPLVLRVLLFGIWRDVSQGLHVYVQSLRLGHDYQPLPLYVREEEQQQQQEEEGTLGNEEYGGDSMKSYAEYEYLRTEENYLKESTEDKNGVEGHNPPVNTLENASDAKTNNSTTAGKNCTSHQKEYIFVDFNPVWEVLNYCTPVLGTESPRDLSSHLLLALVAHIFRKADSRLQQQLKIIDASDYHMKHLFQQFHSNFKSRLRLKSCLRILVDVYGNLFQIRLRVLLLFLFLINFIFITLVIVQHLVIQIFFERYNIQHVVLKWLVPRTTWFFVMNCLFLSILVGAILFLPVFRFVSLLVGTADHTYCDAAALLERIQQPRRYNQWHSQDHREGLIPLLRQELHELFLFLKNDFTKQTGIELNIVIYIDDIDKLQHHQSPSSMTSHRDVLLQLFENLKYVLLTLEQAPVLLFLAIDRSNVAYQLENSSSNQCTCTATAAPAATTTQPPLASASVWSPASPQRIPVWGYDYLDKHIIDLPFHLPELTKHKVQHFLSASVLPSHDFLIQNALRAVYGLLEHLNSLDLVAIEFLDVEFLEDLSLLSEEKTLHASVLSDSRLVGDNNVPLPAVVVGTSSHAQSESECFPATDEQDERQQDKGQGQGQGQQPQLEGAELAKATEKVAELKEIREGDPRDEFATYFYNTNNNITDNQPVIDDENQTSPRSETKEEGAGLGGEAPGGEGVSYPNLNNTIFKKHITKKVFRAKTLKTALNRLNESWKHRKTRGHGEGHNNLTGSMAADGPDQQKQSRTSGILSFLVGAGRLLTKEISITIDLYQADAPEGVELFCKALTAIIMSLRITFRFTAVPSRFLLTPAISVTQSPTEHEDLMVTSWEVAPFREVKRVIVDADALKTVVMKDANGNLIDMQNLHGKNFLQANNYGRIKELSPHEMKALKSDVIKQVKRREIIKAKKIDMFRDDNKVSRKTIKFILFAEWSSDSRYLMFACNDGVVAVVDCFANTERVAGELYREVVTTPLEGEKEGQKSNVTPMNITVTSMSMSPSTSYLAVGGGDGKVAVYDTTRDWEEIQLLDISSQNDIVDAQAPLQVKVTALSWCEDSTLLVIGDNRGNIFLITTVGRVALTHSVASSGRSSAMVEFRLPSDEPAAKPAWRVIQAIFNREYTYSLGVGPVAPPPDSKKRRKKEKKKDRQGELKRNDSLLSVQSSDDESGRGSQSQQTERRGSERRESVRRSSARRESGREEDSATADGEDGYNDLRLDPLETVTCLRWSADKAFIVAGRRNRELTLYLHDGHNFGEQSVRLVGHASAVTCLAIAHSDTWAVSGSEDTYLRVWNITRALPLCVSSNTRRSASTKTSPAPELPPDSNSLCVSILAGHSGGVTGLAITPSDRYVISCSKDASIILWNIASGGTCCHVQQYPVMVMAISSDMQLLAHACNVDGTLRIAQLNSTAQARFVSANLHSIQETLRTEDYFKRTPHNSKSTCLVSDILKAKHHPVDILFQRVDSDSLMAQITHDQLDVLSYMQSLLQPYLLHSNIVKVKRIVQVVHLVNRWAANKRIKRRDINSLVHLDPRWEIFSLKVAQWAYLCEYFPFRMSFLVHMYIEGNYNHNRNHTTQQCESKDLQTGADVGTGAVDSPGCQEASSSSRVCVFFQQHVQPKLYRIHSAAALARLDGPPEVFASLLAATPSTALTSKMFAATFQHKFHPQPSAAAVPVPTPIMTSLSANGHNNVNPRSSACGSGEGGRTHSGSESDTAVQPTDLTDITGSDVLAACGQHDHCITDNEDEDEDVDFHFWLLECTFNLDPYIRHLISLECEEIRDSP